MGRHIADADCGELKAYFTSVIDWIDGVFKGVSLLLLSRADAKVRQVAVLQRLRERTQRFASGGSVIILR